MKIFNLIFVLALCFSFTACSDLDEPQDQTEISTDDRTIDVCRRLLTVANNNTPPQCNDALGITIAGYDYPPGSGQCCITFNFPHEGPWDWCMIGPQTGPPFMAVPVIYQVPPFIFEYRICVTDTNLFGFEDINNGQCQSILPNC